MQKSSFRRATSARASSDTAAPAKVRPTERPTVQREEGAPPTDRLTLISFYVMVGALAAALVYLAALLIVM